MAFNNLNQMPRKLISLSNETLHALSLIGNDFRCQTQTCLGIYKTKKFSKLFSSNSLFHFIRFCETSFIEIS